MYTRVDGPATASGPTVTAAAPVTVVMADHLAAMYASTDCMLTVDRAPG